MKKMTNDTQGRHIEGDRITIMERDQEKRNVLCMMLKNIKEGTIYVSPFLTTKCLFWNC